MVVNQLGWETVLENNKQAYALEFVQTSCFIGALLQKSAQPTIENSPPLQRWDQIRECSRVRETDG